MVFGPIYYKTKIFKLRNVFYYLFTTFKRFVHVNLHGFRLFDIYLQPFFYTKQLKSIKQVL
jgi:hypothetical protein